MGNPSLEDRAGTALRMGDSARLVSPMAGACVNAMSVDVEDYFQVSAFESVIDRGAWEELPRRVERNTRTVMALFDDHDVKATFFVLGWVAERHPALVRDIVADGHELASHGYEHVRATEQSRSSLLEDVSRTKAMLEDISGVPVRGYRAASYSIGRSNLWALEVLAAAGYDYSSSIYPIRHDLYGMPEAPRFAFRPDGVRLLEIPITTLEMLGRRLPIGGGGYFRLFPYHLSRAGIRRVNRREGQPCVFYFHPWEVDPDQPRQANISLKTRFRHYLNLGRMTGRLRRLLADFKWDRMDRVYLGGAVK